ncbi:MAG: SH3 domain-containing protein [Candidatus Gracilibacteria bacterium]|nr:SH3 domain-containing protein [Candidatus Gracilibacteria bacterium]
MKTTTKKILTKIVLGGMLIGSIASTTTLADDYSYVKVVHLNIRSAGVHTAKIIATVDKGYKVTVLETLANGWKKVILENGEQGYLNGKYITEEMPHYPKVDGSRYTIKSGMAFLRGFNMVSKVAVLKKGDVLDVTSDKLYLDKWVQVRVAEAQIDGRYVGRTGYVAKRLLEVVSGYEVAVVENPVSSDNSNSVELPFELNSAPEDPSAIDENSSEESIDEDTSSDEEDMSEEDTSSEEESSSEEDVSDESSDDTGAEEDVVETILNNIGK